MTMTGARVFIDTNVLLRATITQFTSYDQTQQVLSELLARNTELWISRQVIREYIVQATRPQVVSFIMTPDEILSRYKAMMSVFQIADETAEVTAQLIALLHTYPTGGKQIHDANIVATMLANGVDTLLTMNVADFRRFEGRIHLFPLQPANP